jgi:hypothetical protein
LFNDAVIFVSVSVNHAEILTQLHVPTVATPLRIQLMNSWIIHKSPCVEDRTAPPCPRDSGPRSPTPEGMNPTDLSELYTHASGTNPTEKATTKARPRRQRTPPKQQSREDEQEGATPHAVDR